MYYSPDSVCDTPAKGEPVRDGAMKVRMMLPLSVRCNTCGVCLYKGTKFNTRMEEVEAEDFLGLRIYRSYWRCTGCAAEFTLKTDPENSDYAVEHGVCRLCKPWQEVWAAQRLQQEEEMARENAMKGLANLNLLSGDACHTTPS